MEYWYFEPEPISSPRYALHEFRDQASNRGGGLSTRGKNGQIIPIDHCPVCPPKEMPIPAIKDPNLECFQHKQTWPDQHWNVGFSIRHGRNGPAPSEKTYMCYSPVTANSRTRHWRGVVAEIIGPQMVHGPPNIEEQETDEQVIKKAPKIRKITTRSFKICLNSVLIDEYEAADIIWTKFKNTCWASIAPEQATIHLELQSISPMWYADTGCKQHPLCSFFTQNNAK